MAHDYVREVCDDLGVCTEEALDASRNKTSPSINVASSRSKPTAMEACRNKTSPSVDPSPSEPPQTRTESSGVFNKTPEKLPPNEIRIPLMGSSQLQDLVETESSSSRNRWSTYAKRCHEMIAFLTAATLAFLPIRYVLDAQRKCGSHLRVEDYIRVIVSFLGDITVVDPFVFLALAYTVSYIVASASLSRSKVQTAELVSIMLGFAMVFLVIFYISPITFCVCLVFGLFIGAITIREFCLARRDS